MWLIYLVCENSLCFRAVCLQICILNSHENYSILSKTVCLALCKDEFSYLPWHLETKQTAKQSENWYWTKSTFLWLIFLSTYPSCKIFIKENKSMVSSWQPLNLLEILGELQYASLVSRTAFILISWRNVTSYSLKETKLSPVSPLLT